MLTSQNMGKLKFFNAVTNITVIRYVQRKLLANFFGTTNFLQWNINESEIQNNGVIRINKKTKKPVEEVLN